MLAPSYTHNFRFSSKGNALGTHQSALVQTANRKLRRQLDGTARFEPILTREHPFEPPLTGGHPPLKFLHTHYLGQRGAEKPSTSLAIFMGLSLIPIYKHLECFVMLGTHSEPHRGQMSHIYIVCDISPLRVAISDNTIIINGATGSKRELCSAK